MMLLFVVLCLGFGLIMGDTLKEKVLSALALAIATSLMLAVVLLCGWLQGLS